MKKLEICVIGTSNSIVRGGWLDGLRENSQANVTRLAVGGAPFTQFTAMLQDVVKRKYDCIVVDSSPNDEHYASSVGSSEFFDNLYYMFLSTLRHYFPVIVLRIPTKVVLDIDARVFNRQRAIAEKVGCHVVNLANVIREAKQMPAFADTLYTDNYHPNTDLMRSIGRGLIRDIEYCIGGGRNPALVDFSRNFSGKRVVSEQHEKVGISTSLLNDEFSLLKSGEEYSFPDSFYCLGFFIHGEFCNGIIRLQGRDGFRDIHAYFDPARSPKVKRFIPIKSAFRLSTVHVLSPMEQFEIAIHSDWKYLPPFHVAFGEFMGVDLEPSFCPLPAQKHGA